MRSEDRREQILAAATGVFGDRGYEGATTDAVARAAGVSQPYVVRMFGTKEALFIAVLDRSVGLILDTFRRVLASESPAPHQELAGAYLDLASEERGVVLSMMHGFLLGANPVIGPCARRGFGKVQHFLSAEAGFTADQAALFFEKGMFLNTVLALRLVDDYDTDPDVKSLLDAEFPTKLGLVQRASTRAVVS